MRTQPVHSKLKPILRRAEACAKNIRPIAGHAADADADGRRLASGKTSQQLWHSLSLNRRQYDGL